MPNHERFLQVPPHSNTAYSSALDDHSRRHNRGKADASILLQQNHTFVIYGKRAPSLSHFAVIEVILSLKDAERKNMRFLMRRILLINTELRILLSTATLSEFRSVVGKKTAASTGRSRGARCSEHRHGPVKVPEGLRTCSMVS